MIQQFCQKPQPLATELHHITPTSWLDRNLRKQTNKQILGYKSKTEVETERDCSRGRKCYQTSKQVIPR